MLIFEWSEQPEQPENLTLSKNSPTRQWVVPMGANFVFGK